MHLVQPVLQPIAHHPRAFVLLNIAVYGTLGAAIGVTALFSLRGVGLERAAGFSEMAGPLTAVADAYTNGDALVAALGTFAVNLVFAALLTTTLPSLAVPFFGVAATIYRAAEIGMWLTPTSPDAALAALPHALIVVVEFQIYILAAFGTYVLWRTTFWHRQLGLPSRWAGYRAGLVANLRLYPVIVLGLLVSAVLEALEVVYLLPLLH